MIGELIWRLAVALAAMPGMVAIAVAVVAALIFAGGEVPDRGMLLFIARAGAISALLFIPAAVIGKVLRAADERAEDRWRAEMDARHRRIREANPNRRRPAALNAKELREMAARAGVGENPDDDGAWRQFASLVNKRVGATP